MGKAKGRAGPQAGTAAQEEPESLAFLLQRAHSTIRARMLAALEGSGLHLGHIAILGMLVKDEGLTQRELSLRTGIEKSSMVLFIDHLEREGWIVRKAYPGDRRAYAIALTRRGQEQLKLLGPKLMQAEEQALMPLSAAEKARLRQQLQAIIGEGGQ